MRNISLDDPVFSGLRLNHQQQRGSHNYSYVNIKYLVIRPSISVINPIDFLHELFFTIVTVTFKYEQASECVSVCVSICLCVCESAGGGGREGELSTCCFVAPSPVSSLRTRRVWHLMRSDSLHSQCQLCCLCSSQTQTPRVSAVAVTRRPHAHTAFIPAAHCGPARHLKRRERSRKRLRGKAFAFACAVYAVVLFSIRNNKAAMSF